MSTPGAIAVYTSGSGIPEHVSERPWRGVYHHWDGYPTGLGQHLLYRAQRAQGDLGAVVRQLIDEAPWGWSLCMPGPAKPEGQRFSEEEPGLRVGPEETGAVAYVYVFDVEARRLDMFSTHVGGEGRRLSSVRFSSTGSPDLPALDLHPEETVTEPFLPGDSLSARALKDCLEDLPPLEAVRETDSVRLEWVNTQQEPDESLSILFRVVTFEDGFISNVEEQEWNLVPPSARREPERVRHFLEALAEVLLEDPKRFNSFWISAQDSLRRSGARQRESFARILRAHWARDFGSEDASS
ncbi:hypothetical protein COCOR_01917 [Corallococcus coralloides DSM 2259]|uniref:Uncharacterized protein n=1 Tax=Corallococcus coralloides (strain ATCC 25202 / DSM 2259 / NBRC 100086 / M2) TaxID=1144275 RepID=H8MG76_CORCM|nr:hypothetical protein [Corallococcus coralloides]AFE04378.1 hypothetical protein COCOR_01917 [Corallococcus coralloides DSM 2259]